MTKGKKMHKVCSGQPAGEKLLMPSGEEGQLALANPEPSITVQFSSPG